MNAFVGNLASLSVVLSKYYRGTIHVQLNLFITDTKGTGMSVRIIEVSVLER